jgi:16S rRNA (adenine1518-N6/adenine1519-N6)-dimethyltransferase
VSPIRVGHQPRKRFGQNFLRDDAVIEAIARAIAPLKSDHLVEIGPGEGALTSALINSGCRLDAIELDRDLKTRLLASFSIYPGFTLHSADALQFEFASLASGDEPLRVVGNLPYNISTPLIIRLLSQLNVIRDMHFMLQKEVVDRLAASPGNKHWGRLAILAQADCEVSHLFDVPPEAFYPPPKVQSAIVRLAPKHPGQRLDCDREALKRVVQTAFAQRRKTLRNNFKGLFDDTVLTSLDIDPSARAETLSLADFARLAEAMSAS